MSVAVVLTAVVAAGIAIPLVTSRDSKITDLEAELADTSALLEEVEGERDAANARADAVTSRRDEILSSAREKAERRVEEARETVQDLKARIRETEGKLASKRSKLEEVNASLEQAKRTKQMSTFSDGTWAVGAEVLPGTYRSTAGGNCYWEILQSPSGGGIDNIVDNGFGPNATITLSEGQWVHSDGCGTWRAGP